MMTRFCAYAEKVFSLGSRMARSLFNSKLLSCGIAGGEPTHWPPSAIGGILARHPGRFPRVRNE
jgi:hypothetical protein